MKLDATKYQPLPASIRRELSLELANGSRVFNDYTVGKEQVANSNTRFLRLVEKIMQKPQ